MDSIPIHDGNSNGKNGYDGNRLCFLLIRINNLHVPTFFSAKVASTQIFYLNSAQTIYSRLVLFISWVMYEPLKLIFPTGEPLGGYCKPSSLNLICCRLFFLQVLNNKESFQGVNRILIAITENAATFTLPLPCHTFLFVDLIKWKYQYLIDLKTYWLLKDLISSL